MYTVFSVLLSGHFDYLIYNYTYYVCNAESIRDENEINQKLNLSVFFFFIYVGLINNNKKRIC